MISKPTQEEFVVEINKADLIFNKNNKKEFKALEALDMKIKSGQIFCLLGPNGSGKTTTINLINGLLEPTSGDITVLGMNPSKSRKTVLQKISLVPQETALYNDLTARENLLFHARYYGVNRKFISKRIDNVLGIVQLENRQNDRVGTFSGGMQRRLALARALLTEPEILLLDEPTLGVDVQSRNAIWEQIRTLASVGKTVILTTNYMEEAEELGEQVLIIDKGKPVASGSPNELKRHIGQKQMIIHFNETKYAKQVYDEIAEDYEVTCTRNQLNVNTNALNVQFQLLEQLSKYEEYMNHIEYSEPNLQDVFLHFTGKALRD
ncbi:ABC transporter ATP-binding protein [Saliterribacillus persicus]|uniref:Nodulation factor export ABC transporter ATP-binding protein NodI n=1 Tax=Saliterribacillus persicus TaxID=930114 RepID=A0A368Y0P7_9BACI|nr:ATP-binding cassette domain-containing protein [Saliterribacillus persicus]RCW73269.1 nodulation factor export ABC transporter ATP-binding protein NodI [Saliterribacillus persicus]